MNAPIQAECPAGVNGEHLGATARISYIPRRSIGPTGEHLRRAYRQCECLKQSEDGTVRVCEHCLKENAIDARLALHAQRLEAQAQEVRSLIGRLKLPTYEEWLAEAQRRCGTYGRR